MPAPGAPRIPYSPLLTTPLTLSLKRLFSKKSPMRLTFAKVITIIALN
nr:MAG TPA: hypothetical protein [Caudoviricetes sp.]